MSKKYKKLIKLDIEGGERIVIEDAIDLISKYHVPFVFSEYNPNFLQRHGTDPKKYIELFTKNGYKISFKGFLNVLYDNLSTFILKIRKYYVFIIRDIDGYNLYNSSNVDESSLIALDVSINEISNYIDK